MKDLEIAFKTLSDKNTTHTLMMQYYDGSQPLKYSTKRLEEAFSLINARFSQNWCAVVVDSVMDRLTLKGWDTNDTAMSTTLSDLWESKHLQLDADDAHLAALITNEAYLIAWKDEDDETQLWYNDPRLCHVFYKGDDPKRKEFAAKWWREDERLMRLNLYYPDRIEYYSAESKNTPESATAFKPDSERPVEANPYGEIPVFHLRCNRRGTAPELQNVTALQDAVNKLLADMMVTAEFGAYRQRYIITNSDTKALKNAPNEIWQIPAGDGMGQATSVGQFEASGLDNFLNAIDKLANSIAIISRTPKHYFYSAGSGISGEALLAMESPLVAKVQSRQENFSVTWKEVAAFLLKLETGKDVDTAIINPIWQPIPSMQPFTEAQTIKTAVDSGIPLETELRRQGWGNDEIKQMVSDKAKEKKATATETKLILDRMRIKREQDDPFKQDEEEEKA